MSDDLEPCPFCGWDAPYVRATGIETEVYCQNCTAVGPMVHSVGPDEDVDEVAIKMWNRRAKTKAEQAFEAPEHIWATGTKDRGVWTKENTNEYMNRLGLKSIEYIRADLYDNTILEAAAEMLADEHGWVRRERLEKAVDRIEQLERARKDLEKLSVKLLNEKLHGEWREPLENDLAEAQAKLAKAVEGIKAMMEITMYPDEVWDKGNVTLAELGGGE